MCSISVESACIRMMQLHLENVFFSIVPKTVICIERALKHRLLLRVVLVGPCLENLLGFAGSHNVSKSPGDRCDCNLLALSSA